MTIDLTRAGAARVELEMRVLDPERPSVIVVRPDGYAGEAIELVGAIEKARELGAGLQIAHQEDWPSSSTAG